MPDAVSPDHDFASRYANFLCAAHRSFPAARTRLPRPWELTEHRSSRKPWRPVLDAALRQSPRPDGVILEFGVFKGDSIRRLARRKPHSVIHGFDSFRGFPDDARKDWSQDFSLPSLPVVPANVTLHAGFFEDTVPPFIAQWDEAPPPIALVHIDCDIFSSTHTVLSALGPHLRTDDIIVFDELMNYTEFATNEFLALYLMLDRLGLDFEWAVAWGKAYPLVESEGRMLDVAFDGYRAAGYFQNQAIRLCKRRSGGHFDASLAPQPLIDRLSRDLASPVLLSALGMAPAAALKSRGREGGERRFRPAARR